MALQLQTPASVPAVTLAEAKLHLRVEVDDDDALISSLVAAATLAAEHLMNRAIMPQKWLFTSDMFGTNFSQQYPGSYDSKIPLNKPTVTGVDSVKYVDSATGILTTLDPSIYQVVKASDYSASIVPAFGKAWPTPRNQPESVQVIFSCGYADAASVPDPIKIWIKLQVGAMYENRESERIERGAVCQLGFVDSLLDRYRVWSL